MYIYVCLYVWYTYVCMYVFICATLTQILQTKDKNISMIILFIKHYMKHLYKNNKNNKKDIARTK